MTKDDPAEMRSCRSETASGVSKLLAAVIESALIVSMVACPSI